MTLPSKQYDNVCLLPSFAFKLSLRINRKTRALKFLPPSKIRKIHNKSYLNNFPVKFFNKFCGCPSSAAGRYQIINYYNFLPFFYCIFMYFNNICPILQRIFFSFYFRRKLAFLSDRDKTFPQKISQCPTYNKTS